FGVHNEVGPLLFSLFEPLGEKGAEITLRIIEFVERMKVGVLGSVGLVLLLYTVISVM
ncbi:MAG: ribonuclease BN, partial [Rhodospirillaceae bacterium]|nr:ribonuclease BN [Rhodospirillaceae bacterium]